MINVQIQIWFSMINVPLLTPLVELVCQVLRIYFQVVKNLVQSVLSNSTATKLVLN